MPFYTDAYLADTTHLSTEEHGAYLLLLLWMWRQNGSMLPAKDAELARICGLSVKRWKTVRPVLERFFTITAEGWQQKRLHATWQEVSRKIARSRVAGSKGGRVSAQRRTLSASLFAE